MLERFDRLAAEAGVELSLADLLPGIASAGQPAGELTEAGAKLLDPSGRLPPGIPLFPPEGDAATGMVATNSVAPQIGRASRRDRDKISVVAGSLKKTPAASS